MTTDPNLRRAVAAERLAAAWDETALSDVMYDAAEDGHEQPDGEGGWETPDHGYDLDDLAAVMLPLLASASEVATLRAALEAILAVEVDDPYDAFHSHALRIARAALLASVSSEGSGE